MHHIPSYSFGNIEFRHRMTNFLVQQPLASQGLFMITLRHVKPEWTSTSDQANAETST